MAKAKVESIKRAVYYSPHRKQAIEVPIRDESGKFKLKTDKFGNVMLGRNAEPIILTKMVEFSVLVDSPKTGYQCVLAVDFVKNDKGEAVPADKDLFEALEALADDPGTKIIREDDHKQKINPTAFELEKQLRAKDSETAALKEALSKKDSSYSEAVAKMQKEMADLRAMLDEQTKPNGGVKKGS